MSNVTNKIGCESGRTKIVDPNDFSGFNSETNMSVPLEDLNISVVLKTFRKGRTVLTSSGSQSTTGSRESTETVSINFIEGSTIGGKKSLSTNYTDLTVLGSDSNNDEALGITNIEIDFNSSMAPMVNISFIDVRGSAIFQNEQNISGNHTSNKYSTFFQLPYPKFELEVKGYYGKPVTYCLHMLKFNSKFNSKTGNFEITCQFIGYTYAMLSDMLIGYLKAIPYTKIGAEKFAKYNAERGYEVITLVELMKRISSINDGVEKIASTSENAIKYENIQRGLEDLDIMENIINTFGNDLDFNTVKKTKYPFVVRKNIALDDKDKSTITNYRTKIKEIIDVFNDKQLTTKLDPYYFENFELKSENKGLYNGVTKVSFEPNNNINDATLKVTLGDPNNFYELKQNIYEWLQDGYVIDNNIKIDVYNLNGLFNRISVYRSNLEKKLKESKEGLANDLKVSVRDSLGFEPTVRKIVEIFTAAIEVFMETIYDVSVAAEKKENISRINQLATKFTENLVTDIKLTKDDTTFFAWPDYREKNSKTNTYVDKYLGEKGVLEKPQDVNELVFIDDLLQAFLTAEKISNEVEANLENSEKTWYPINPLDSMVFYDTEPYERNKNGEITTSQEISKILLLRGMTFLGYTNDESTFNVDEITNMAIAESEALLRTLKNPTLKQSLSYLNFNELITTEGVVNSTSRKVIKFENGSYKYNYIFNGDDFKLIPLDYKNEKWGDIIESNGVYTESSKNYKNLRESRDNDGEWFLTNYGYRSGFYKPDDGGTYVKILKASEYEMVKEFYPLDKPIQIKPIEYQLLGSEFLNAQQVGLAGFNVFNGTLGIQEYSVINFGGVSMPLMYVFYGDKRLGLAQTRKKTGKLVSKFDYPKDTNKRLPWNINGYEKELYETSPTKLAHAKNGSTRELFNEFINDSTNITYPYVDYPINITHSYNIENLNLNEKTHFSLFGSYWYYLQASSTIIINGETKNLGRYSKALLFLNTLPFFGNGIGDDFDALPLNDPDKIYQIMHLFDIRGGFIHAPRLWCAYIGGILWRMDAEDPIFDGDDITGGGSGNQDPIIWKKNKQEDWGNIPSRFDYFPAIQDTYGFHYPDIIDDNVIRTIPNQVKKEFKKVFFDFVNGTTEGLTTWKSIKDNLEIWDGSTDGFGYVLRNSFLNDNNSGDNDSNEFNVNKLDSLKNKDKYQIIYPNSISSYERGYFFLELKDGYNENIAVKTLIDALNEELIIANNGFKIWKSPTDNTTRVPIKVSKNVFELYFNTLLKKLNETSDSFSPTNEKKNLEQEIFGTANEDTIKLQLYRTCKNIHDKWLAGTTDPNNIIFQCGSNTRSRVDTELSTYLANTTKTRLIDSFRFISRSFRDIGDELYVNPLPINDYLIDNPNTSSYDSISSLLASNNFDFIALPTFINFRDSSEVEAIFEPFPNYTKAISGGVCGPSFVCAYVGQKSQHLAYSNSDYPNDGFDLRCNGRDIDPNVPDDFKTANLPHEDAVGAFVVRYSQQNQNIFKDIELDQSEFTETDESLQIQEDISQKGSETNRTIAGQNLYNVYAVRSYSAQVEMMGNAMIQPMMYFQLDNIPMFHGAYMITRVKHSIKPNNMSTNFTGVRIRYAETPLVSAMDLYMSFVDEMDASGSIGGGNGTGTIPKRVSPLVQTLIDNGVTGGNINSGNIKSLAITDDIPGVMFQISKEKRQMISEAVTPLREMLKDWAKWMADTGFKPLTKRNGENIYAYITSMFRQDGSNSMHAFGIAVDLQMGSIDGKIFQNQESTTNVNNAFDFKKNPALKWLYNNSYKYGFVQPSWANDGKGVGSSDGEEWWHWEYQGKSAICFLRDRPIPTVGNNNPSDNPTSEISETKIKSFVKNPKDKNGKDVNYGSGCSYKTANASDKANGVNANVETTKISDIQKKQNQKTVKNKLKEFGLTKKQVAGIMGNINQESKFNPTLKSSVDKNGVFYYGLMQWSSKYVNLNVLGNTVESQMKYLLDSNSDTNKNFKKFLNYNETKNNIEQATFLFGKEVERCSYCYNLEIFNSKEYKRIPFANEFYSRFNDSNDELFW